ncbi:TIGR02300 family protein [Roseibium salinum]|uniref:TIGR02300 family protein n=1 Tax=Roseibium salinum TaxID=1604349 RepID=A0ABT3R587_9HYPH|nr:TIGR02300 family protein [Roseibium sp. DSM 29163]MCX2724348.1 TIGR02300 family protein [Roseibium sp. DSM 29163]
MAKPELGTKRLCPSCGAKYYDLNRTPITCPKCGTVFEAVMTSRAAKAAKVQQAPEDDEEEEDTAAPELVTLEEADAEAEGGDDDVPDLAEAEVDLADDDSGDDDVFIDDEDEDEDSVPGIRVEIDEDPDR